jgi:ribosomal protein S18 acetylase RimI-like enzyme
MTARIVPGLRLRPYAGEPDLAAIVRIQNLEAEVDGIPERTDVEGLAARFGHPNDHFDARRDVTIAEVDGAPVAVATREWVTTTDGLREYRHDGAVDPAWRRRGIGTVLLAESQRLLTELAAAHPTSSPSVFGSWTGDTQHGSVALLRAAGYSPARWFFEMTRPSLENLPVVALPEGLVVRPITTDSTKAVWHASIEAFRAHWGGFDGSDERLQQWLAAPSTDISLWVVAFDGDEVAGAVINAIDAAENAALGLRQGWLASVFTRRQWRRRGVAQALIAESLLRLRDRGMTSAGLGVDADNANGALGLYERLGFEVEYRSTAWRMPLAMPSTADRDDPGPAEAGR